MSSTRPRVRSRARFHGNAGRVVAGAVAVLLAACQDSPTGTTAVPADFHLATSALSGNAGVALVPAPTFTLTDVSGNTLAGISFTVAVTAGGGAVTGTPTVTTSGATSIGTWTLGKTAGTNTITVSAKGMAPFTISAQGMWDPLESTCRHASLSIL